ncbi:MAG TPA: hypothetical protein DCP28_37710 [Cytophagales bacterium]|nr:hypothetical protein [Cytophagales bacterium]
MKNYVLFTIIGFLFFCTLPVWGQGTLATDNEALSHPDNPYQNMRMSQLRQEIPNLYLQLIQAEPCSRSWFVANRKFVLAVETGFHRKWLTTDGLLAENSARAEAARERRRNRWVPRWDIDIDLSDSALAGWKAQFVACQTLNPNQTPVFSSDNQNLSLEEASYRIDVEEARYKQVYLSTLGLSAQDVYVRRKGTDLIVDFSYLVNDNLNLGVYQLKDAYWDLLETTADIIAEEMAIGFQGRPIPPQRLNFAITGYADATPFSSNATTLAFEGIQNLAPPYRHYGKFYHILDDLQDTIPRSLPIPDLNADYGIRNNTELALIRGYNVYKNLSQYLEGAQYELFVLVPEDLRGGEYRRVEIQMNIRGYFEDFIRSVSPSIQSRLLASGSSTSADVRVKRTTILWDVITEEE